MKHIAIANFLFALLGVAVICVSCGGNAEKQAIEADSISTETIPDSTKATKLMLIPGSLELGIPAGVIEKSRAKSSSADTIVFEVEMGQNPMNLAFDILRNSDETMSIEQMEEQRLFVNDEGKTFEHSSGSIYRSQWYALPYALERKFRLSSYKDENDYSTLVEDAEKNGTAALTENQTLSAYTSRYFIQLSTTQAGKPRRFVLVLELIVGC